MRTPLQILAQFATLMVQKIKLGAKIQYPDTLRKLHNPQHVMIFTFETSLKFTVLMLFKKKHKNYLKNECNFCLT